MTGERKLTADELAATAQYWRGTVTGFDALLDHIAAQDSEIERLRTALEAIAGLDTSWPPGDDYDRGYRDGQQWIKSVVEQKLAALAGESETPPT